MNRVLSSVAIVASFVFMLDGAVSWGQLPPTNDTSDLKGNTGSGTGALLSNTTGIQNTASGDRALLRNTTGSANTASGSQALSFNTTGSANTASGSQALLSNTTGSYNTATGFEALVSNTASYNTATGNEALFSNSTGHNNTASGYQALFRNTTGFRNTASGQQTLYSNSSGYRNTAVGALALYDNSTGTNNSALGVSALENNLGHYNTAAGVYALFSNTTGSINIALGYQAGYNLTTGSNNITIGNYGVAGESSTIRVGRSGTNTRTFIAGIAGVPISGATVTINNAGQLGILPSAARYKQHVQPMGAQSAKLHHLRPVTFEYKHDPQGVQQYGLIAEEVAQVYPELVVRGANGEVESVQYHELIPMLLNEVQHQQRELVELQAQNERLQAALEQRDAEQRAQTAALAARLEHLEHAPPSATVAAR